MEKRSPKVYQPEEIRSLRKFFRFTRRDIADRFMISVNTVKSWEFGQRNPSGAAMVLLIMLDEERAEKIAERERYSDCGRAVLTK